MGSVRRRNFEHVRMVLGEPALIWSWHLRDIEGNAENFYHDCSSRRLNKGNGDLLMKKTDDSVATDTAFIALLFIDKLCLLAVPSESIQGVSSAVDEDWVKECLQDLDQCKSVGPDGLHLSMLRELADAVVMLPCTIFEKSWRSRSSLTTGMQMLHSSSERWVNLISVWAKQWDGPLGIAGHVKMICNGQGGFVSKSKSCLRSLSAFYDD